VLALLLLAVVIAPPAAAREVATTGDLRVLVVLAGFPDRPLAHDRAHFIGSPTSLIDRLVAYYAEVSGGRLRVGRDFYTPVGMKGWYHAIFRNSSGEERLITIDQLLRKMNDWV